MIDIYAVAPENETLIRKQFSKNSEKPGKIDYAKMKDRMGTANLCFVEVKAGSDIWALPGGDRVLGRAEAERIADALVVELCG